MKINLKKLLLILFFINYNLLYNSQGTIVIINNRKNSKKEIFIKNRLEEAEKMLNKNIIDLKIITDLKNNKYGLRHAIDYNSLLYFIASINIDNNPSRKSIFFEDIFFYNQPDIGENETEINQLRPIAESIIDKINKNDLNKGLNASQGINNIKNHYINKNKEEQIINENNRIMKNENLKNIELFLCKDYSSKRIYLKRCLDLNVMPVKELRDRSYSNSIYLQNLFYQNSNNYDENLYNINKRLKKNDIVIENEALLNILSNFNGAVIYSSDKIYYSFLKNKYNNNEEIEKTKEICKTFMEYYIESKFNKTIDEYIKLSNGKAIFTIDPKNQTLYFELENNVIK